METKDYLKDISEIKELMNKSSQFMSLSGLSGVLAGIYALVGAFFAYSLLPSSVQNYETKRAPFVQSEQELTMQLIIIAVIVIILSLVTGILMSTLKAKKQGEKLWNTSSKRLIINFSIPLFVGGIFALLLLQKEYYGLIAPITLLFYGLACVNASKYTLRDVRSLGITLLILGLLSTYFIGYGLYFWALGFGVCHIVYGSIMYFKYDRN